MGSLLMYLPVLITSPSDRFKTKYKHCDATLTNDKYLDMYVCDGPVKRLRSSTYEVFSVQKL